MNDLLNFEPYWAASQLVLVARYGSSPARRIGQAKGRIDEGGICFLGDIVLEDEIKVPGGFLGLRKRIIQIRRQGFGKQLLARFEYEMSSRGGLKIQGNLVPESPDRLEWLIGWYRGQGYEFNPGETVGECAPPDTAGVVAKTLHKSCAD